MSSLEVKNVSLWFCSTLEASYLQGISGFQATWSIDKLMFNRSEFNTEVQTIKGMSNLKWHLETANIFCVTNNHNNQTFHFVVDTDEAVDYEIYYYVRKSDSLNNFRRKY